MRGNGLGGYDLYTEELVDPLVGHILGPYELTTRLGAGGMGTVYYGVHRRLRRARAIKILPANLAADATFVERFEQEARLAADLEHPNIVRIYDVDERDGVHYIAMELLAGRSLRDLVRHDGPLPIERALHLLGQLANALEFAHDAGVAHRDVKPANAFVGPNDHLTLVDFGIAKAAQDAGLTGTGMMVGTAEYMAPEVIRGGENGTGSDLYALGIVAYELLTGRVPFTGVNSQVVMYAQVHEPPPPPRRFRLDLPEGIEQVVLRQLAKDPAERYARAADLVAALRTAVPTVFVPPVPVPPIEPSLLQRDEAPSPAHLGQVVGSPGTLPPTAATQVPTVQVPKPHPMPSPSQLGTRDELRAAAPPAILGSDTLGPRRRTSAMPKLVAGGAIVLMLVALAILPTPVDPQSLDSMARLSPPTWIAGPHPLGTDPLGRDVLSRLVHGARLLLLRCGVIVLVVGSVGLGIRRGPGKRRLDEPRLIIAITATLIAAVLAEAVYGLFSLDQLMHLGVLGTFIFGAAPLPAPSWGNMLLVSWPFASIAPWLVTIPLVSLLVVTLGVGLLGSGLIDRSPRHRDAAP